MERNEQWKGLGLVPVKSPSIVHRNKSLIKCFTSFCQINSEKRMAHRGKQQ